MQFRVIFEAPERASDPPTGRACWIRTSDTLIPSSTLMCSMCLRTVPEELGSSRAISSVYLAAGSHRVSDRARKRRTGSATPLSCSSPAASNETGLVPTAETTASVTSTSPGFALPATREATLTVRPK